MSPGLEEQAERKVLGLGEQAKKVMEWGAGSLEHVAGTQSGTDRECEIELTNYHLE